MDSINRLPVDPIPAMHIDMNGVRGMLLDCTPDILPGGVHMMLFHPGSLDKRGEYHLPAGTMVMIIDSDICKFLRPHLQNARIQNQADIAKREARLKNGGA
jgi:hypothetical protein